MQIKCSLNEECRCYQKERRTVGCSIVQSLRETGRGDWAKMSPHSKCIAFNDNLFKLHHYPKITLHNFKMIQMQYIFIFRLSQCVSGTRPQNVLHFYECFFKLHPRTSKHNISKTHVPDLHHIGMEYLSINHNLDIIWHKVAAILVFDRIRTCRWAIVL